MHEDEFSGGLNANLGDVPNKNEWTFLEHKNPLQILSSLGLVPSPCFHMSSNRIVTPHHGGPYLALMSSNGIVTPHHGGPYLISSHVLQWNSDTTSRWTLALTLYL